MRVHRWLMITLLLALAAGLTPALAADDEPVKDKGQNVYEVYARKSNLYNVLPGEEAEKIRVLQQERKPVVLLSTISPDDQAVLALRGDDVGFLGVQDGSFVRIDLSTFERVFPVGLFGAFGGTFWLDGRTLGSLGFAARDAEPDDQGS